MKVYNSQNLKPQNPSIPFTIKKEEKTKMKKSRQKPHIRKSKKGKIFRAGRGKRTVRRSRTNDEFVISPRFHPVMGHYRPVRGGRVIKGHPQTGTVTQKQARELMFKTFKR